MEEEPPDPEGVKVWYRQWRRNLIKDYKLEGLVPEEEENGNENEPIS